MTISDPCQIKFRNCVIEDSVATSLTNFLCRLEEIQQDFEGKIGAVQDKIDTLESPLEDTEQKLESLYLTTRDPIGVKAALKPEARLSTIPEECEVYLVGNKIVFKGTEDLTCLRKLFESLAGPPPDLDPTIEPDTTTVTDCSTASEYSHSASGASASGYIDVSTEGVDFGGETETTQGSNLQTDTTTCTTTTKLTDPPDSTYVEWMSTLVESSQERGILVTYTDLSGNFIGANKNINKLATETGIPRERIVSWVFWFATGDASIATDAVTKKGTNQLQVWGFEEELLIGATSGSDSDSLKVCFLTNPYIVDQLKDSIGLTSGEIELLMRMIKPEKIKLTSNAKDFRGAIERLKAQHANWTDQKARTHVETCIDLLWRSITTEHVVNTETAIDNLFSGCVEFDVEGGVLGEFTADLLAPIAAAVDAIIRTVNAMLKKLQATINAFLDRLEDLINSLSFMFGIGLDHESGGNLWECLFKLEFGLGLGILVVAELELAIDTLMVEAYGLWGLIGLAIEPIVLALKRGLDFVRDLSGTLGIIIGVPCIIIPIDLPFCVSFFLELMFDLMAAVSGMLEKGSLDLAFKSHALARVVAEMKVGWHFSLDFNLEGGLLVAAILTL